MTEFTQTVIDCSIPSASGRYYTIRCLDNIVDQYQRNDSNPLLIEYHSDGYLETSLTELIDFARVGFITTDLYRDGDKLIISAKTIDGSMMAYVDDIIPRLEVIGSGYVSEINGKLTVTDYTFVKLIAVPAREDEDEDDDAGTIDTVSAEIMDTDYNGVTGQTIDTEDLISLLFPYINMDDYVSTAMDVDGSTLNINVFTKPAKPISQITINDMLESDPVEIEPITGDLAEAMLGMDQMSEDGHDDCNGCDPELSLLDLFAALGITLGAPDEIDCCCADETPVSQSVGIIAEAFMEDRDYFRGWCDNLSVLMQDRADVARDTANGIAAAFINMAFGLPALDDDTSVDELLQDNELIDRVRSAEERSCTYVNTDPYIPEERSQSFRRMFLGLPDRD